MTQPDLIVSIVREEDVVVARQEGRRLAEEMGLGLADQTRLATAISELARNILHYAGSGQAIMRMLQSGSTHGLEVVLEDHGPGIPDTTLAMQDGYTTREGSLGAGLPGARRLAHEFDLKTRSEVAGTTVTIRMWLRSPARGSDR